MNKKNKSNMGIFEKEAVIMALEFIVIIFLGLLAAIIIPILLK
jgi:hypothetical protein